MKILVDLTKPCDENGCSFYSGTWDRSCLVPRDGSRVIPLWDENGRNAPPPSWCPLRSGPVTVEAKPQDGWNALASHEQTFDMSPPPPDPEKVREGIEASLRAVPPTDAEIMAMMLGDYSGKAKP